MERDGQPELYDLVAARLKEAHRAVRTAQVPEPVRQALTRKLLVITAAAKQDLPGAARRLERLIADVDAGRMPPDPPGHGRDGTA
ncbi:hypothetical protein H7827_06145 [Streptomyces sp. JH002]|jgi:hypothetical protein|uniref:Uncharacterized protein n=1 Tax=Streptomyces xiamenensis TaxID=408015 RepID=A0A0F7FZR3_9ACTN|nr:MULTISPECIES: hypothetical protein [Streptomyces]AKG45753.1 hypothetical protein SXIM_43690 [Streptomyces xiamenensis]MCU4750199.1 hypothetical protein [Streptomyces sp. G-5]QQN77008.1 hypothetical protein IPZ77_05765 [Streptomyces sp. XC 2026]